ncbi:MAG: phosphomannomutase, partial [Firmicutes bacterium]|nr:phosphomannomutase [Bacillota bacterium]
MGIFKGEFKEGVTLNPAVFREYDIRGIAGQDFDQDDIVRLGRAFATDLKAHGLSRAIVGRDSRTSSPAYRDALVAGLTAGGVDVTDIGEVTTPIFYFARVHLGIEGGAMITASHNPAEFNGF